jgi:hypothetical protein
VNTSVRPESISIQEGRVRLEAADFKIMDGASDPRFEIWLDKHGCPHIINYIGSGQLVRYLKKDIDEIVPIN